jgi:hypothetical protein
MLARNQFVEKVRELAEKERPLDRRAGIDDGYGQVKRFEASDEIR